MMALEMTPFIGQPLSHFEAEEPLLPQHRTDNVIYPDYTAAGDERIIKIITPIDSNNDGKSSSNN